MRRGRSPFATSRRAGCSCRSASIAKGDSEALHFTVFPSHFVIGAGRARRVKITVARSGGARDRPRSQARSGSPRRAASRCTCRGRSQFEHQTPNLLDARLAGQHVLRAVRHGAGTADGAGRRARPTTGPADRGGLAPRRAALHGRRAGSWASSTGSANLLPGSYSFGITGRGPTSARLPAGRLRAAARRLADAPEGGRTEQGAGAVHDQVDSRTMAAAAETHLRRKSVRARAPAALQGRRHVRDRRTPGQRPAGVQEGRRGLDPDVARRRRRPCVHRLSRHAQHRARPVEGRHPLPPRRHARRGQVARDVDDLEVRADGAAVRRRQGRRRLRPEVDVARRARAHDAPVHLRDHQRDRPREGHPGARRRHELRDDGLDLRHLLDEQGALRARRRHRQAADDRRLARAGRGDGARRAVLPRLGVREPGQDARRDARRGPGIRQRRLVLREVRRRGRRERRRDLRLERRRLQRGGLDIAAAFAHKARRRRARRADGRRRDHERRAAPASTATCSRPARSSR